MCSLYSLTPGMIQNSNTRIHSARWYPQGSRHTHKNVSTPRTEIPFRAAAWFQGTGVGLNSAGSFSLLCNRGPVLIILLNDGYAVGQVLRCEKESVSIVYKEAPSGVLPSWEYCPDHHKQIIKSLHSLNHSLSLAWGIQVLTTHIHSVPNTHFLSKPTAKKQPKPSR